MVMGELEKLTEPAILGEGPCWHADESVLYWIDILGKALHCYDPATNTDKQWDMGEMIGTVAPRKKGGLIVALQNGFAFFDPKSGELSRLDPIEPNPETRFNDGKCDPAGRFWCGSMEIKEDASIGTLYRFDENHRATSVVDQIGISNGMSWNADRTTMYYIDSPTRVVSQFDYNLGNGRSHESARRFRTRTRRRLSGWHDDRPRRHDLVMPLVGETRDTA